MFVWLAAFAQAQDLEGAHSSEWDVLPPMSVDVPMPDPVVGGHEVADGRWDDAVGIVLASAYIGCTGTLIGPRVVLTAGHCVTGYPVTHVLVGSKDWLGQEGELIEVDEVVEYPDSWASYDIALLLLATASTTPP